VRWDVLRRCARDPAHEMPVRARCASLHLEQIARQGEPGLRRLHFATVCMGHAGRRMKTARRFPKAEIAGGSWPSNTICKWSHF